MTTRGRLLWILLATAMFSGNVTGQINSLAIDNLRVVSAAGTPVENCDALRDTLNGITDSALNPYVVRLEPGEYDCGSGFLFLGPGLTLEGAGTRSTEIKGEVKSDLVGLLNLNQLTQVRKVSVTNLLSSGPPNSLRVVAIQIAGIGGGLDVAKLDDVRALAGSTVGGPATAIRAADALLFIRSSQLVGSAGAQTVEAAGMDGEIRISFSDLLPGGTVSGDVTCVYSTQSTSLLDADCSVVP